MGARVATVSAASPEGMDRIESAIADTRQRLGASVSSLNEEARALLDMTSPAPESPQPHDTITLAATTLRSIAKVKAMARSGQLTRLVVLLGAGFATSAGLRSRTGRKVLGRLSRAERR